MLKENLEVKEELKEEEKQEMVVSGFGEIQQTSKTKRRYYTTIDVSDVKTLYNLDNVDIENKLNDCEGQMLRIKDVLIKEFIHELDEPVVNSETGEVKEFEVNKVCILIDDAGEKYVTGSKVFTNQMKNYIAMFGDESIKNGLEIKIIKKKINESNNKALAFELV